MDSKELKKIIQRNEDGRYQFKADVKNEISIAQEMVAFSNSGGDEIPVPGLGLEDMDLEYFKSFFERNFGESVDEQGLELQTLLENMNLFSQGSLNVSGALLFASNPSFKLPVFIVKAMAFPGTEIADKHYIDSRDLTGKISEVFSGCMSFVLANIRYIQGDKSVNSIGDPEIPRIVLEELIANALIHRDYFISAPIRLLVFSDRVELISPGHLPNNLTIENIKKGNSNIRNPILASFATKLIPYRGLGSGIVRALKEYPHIDFENDRDGNLFKVTIERREIKP